MQQTRLLRSIVDAQSELVCRFTSNGMILFANNAYAKNRGLMGKQMEGLNFWTFVPREDRPSVTALLATLTRDNPEVTIENRFETVGGSKWFVWKNRALEFDKNGAWTVAQATGFDITERRRAEAWMALAARAAGFGAYEIDFGAGLEAAYFSPEFKAIVGLPPEASIILDAQGLPSFIHPEDRDSVAAAVTAARDPASSGAIHADFRILHSDGAVRWIRWGGQVEFSGEPPHRIARRGFGAIVDITDSKTVDAQQRLLIDELNHRVKNTLTLVQALARQSFKDKAVPNKLLSTFEERLAALAGVHTALTQSKWEGATMDAIAKQALKPFGTVGKRVLQSGPTVRMTPEQAVPIAMILHELYTNATKYGALSVEGGQVELSWFLAPPSVSLHIEWRERSGPRVSEPARKGFGATLIETSARHQLRGDSSLHFLPEGLRCTIVIPLLATDPQL